MGSHDTCGHVSVVPLGTILCEPKIRQLRRVILWVEENASIKLMNNQTKQACK